MTSLKTESGVPSGRVSRSDELLALAARCEAEEPSRHLDLDILMACQMPPGIKPYTTSLDAAVTLVPEGWTGRIGLFGWAELVNLRFDTVSGGRAGINRAALALCAAALRARAALSKQEG